MKYLKISRCISIVAYFVIILKGQIIGLPFLLWLASTVFAFGKIDQLFALLAVLGLIIIFRNWNKTRTREILLADFLCFIHLAAPIIGRLCAVPLALFNYDAFIIPTAVFVLCYLISLAFSFKQYIVFKNDYLEGKGFGVIEDQ